MAEHECRYVGFSGGQQRCPVCLSEKPEATTAGDEDHGDQQEDQRNEANDEGDEGAADDIGPSAAVVGEDGPETVRRPTRRRSSLFKQPDDDQPL